MGNPFRGGEVWDDYHATQRYQNECELKRNYTLEDIVEIYGIDEIENFIRKKKIERITNVNNK